MTDMTETDAAARLARLASVPREIGRGEIYAVTDIDGEHSVLDTEGYSAAPHRVGPRTVTVFDAPSFLDYVTRHLGAGTEVELWSDLTGRTVTAVLNAAADPVSPGWGDHRVKLQLRPDPQWTTWLEVSGQMQRQAVFAEFIEDNQDDFLEPNAATMLDLAQNFNAKKNVNFESAENLTNGTRALNYVETVSARAGEKGHLEIPATVTIALRPFQGAEPYRVTARLRYRITDGVLNIGFKLHRADVVLQDAFQQVLDQVNAGTPDSLRVNHGVI